MCMQPIAQRLGPLCTAATGGGGGGEGIFSMSSLQGKRWWTQTDARVPDRQAVGNADFQVDAASMKCCNACMHPGPYAH